MFAWRAPLQCLLVRPGISSKLDPNLFFLASPPVTHRSSRQAASPPSGAVAWKSSAKSWFCLISPPIFTSGGLVWVFPYALGGLQQGAGCCSDSQPFLREKVLWRGGKASCSCPALPWPERSWGRSGELPPHSSLPEVELGSTELRLEIISPKGWTECGSWGCHTQGKG